MAKNVLILAAKDPAFWCCEIFLSCVAITLFPTKEISSRDPFYGKLRSYISTGGEQNFSKTSMESMWSTVRSRLQSTALHSATPRIITKTIIMGNNKENKKRWGGSRVGVDIAHMAMGQKGLCLPAHVWVKSKSLLQISSHLHRLSRCSASSPPSSCHQGLP